jgi:predicted transcriptional regulator
VEDNIISSLQERRRSLGLTQAQVAKRAGVSQTHYSRIELGKLNPRLTTLRDIARAMSAELVLVPSELETTVLSLTGRNDSHQRRMFRAEPD